MPSTLSQSRPELAHGTRFFETGPAAHRDADQEGSAVGAAAVFLPNNTNVVGSQTGNEFALAPADGAAPAASRTRSAVFAPKSRGGQKFFFFFFFCFLSPGFLLNRPPTNSTRGPTLIRSPELAGARNERRRLHPGLSADIRILDNRNFPSKGRRHFPENGFSQSRKRH